MNKTPEKPKRGSFAKKLVHDLLNRKYVFEGKAVHPGDTVNIMRALDITLIDFLNNEGGFKFNRVNGVKVALMVVQVFFIFLCIGVPSLLKMEWHDKKYLIAFAIVQWYAVMWFRYLKYEWPERHVLQNKNGIKIAAKFDRKRMTYSPAVTIFGQMRSVTMQLGEDKILSEVGEFDKEAFVAKCRPLLELIGKKNQ